MVADTFSSRLRRLVDPPFATYDTQLGTQAHFTSGIFEKWGGRCGHGIPEWENDAPYYGQFFNKNSNVIQLVPTQRGFSMPQFPARLKRFADAHNLPREDRDILRRNDVLSRNPLIARA